MTPPPSAGDHGLVSPRETQPNTSLPADRARLGIGARAPALDAAQRDRLRATLPYLPPLAFLIGLMTLLGIHGEGYALPRVQDDAYFYLEIARNIATTGRSEFTPGVLTNGYQPLWMLVLVTAGSVLGFSVTTVKTLEVLAVCAGFTLFIRLFAIRALLPSILYTSLLWYVAGMFALNGMETSLLFPGLVAFVGACLSRAELITRYRPLAVWLALVFCVAARLDAALVLVPMLAVAPVSRAAKLVIAAGVGALGLGYIAVNSWIFGAAVPVSGLAKSLGGLQLNHAYLAQLARGLELSRLSDRHSPVIPYAAGLATLVLVLALRDRSAVPKLALRMSCAALAGLALYGAKLAFLSSWVIWPWYGFPTLVFVLLAAWIVEESAHALQRYRLALATLGLGLAAVQAQSQLQTSLEGFPEHNRYFIQANADKLAGRVVAMGDRAGSFGFSYPGGVYQIEGLVNSAAYLELVRRGGDLRRHLCEVGVDTLLSYEDLVGDYRQRRIHALQTGLTTYPGPYVDVSREEQLVHSARSARFDPETRRLYAWRLRCPR